MPGDPQPGSDSARRDRLTILFVTSDLYPPFRPAAKALFGDGIQQRGHRVDWLLQAADVETPSGTLPCGNGTAFVARTTHQRTRWSRLWKHCLAMFNDCRVFTLLRRRSYTLVQIKDKYFTALPALIAARWFRVPVFYWLAYPHAEASSYASSQGVARYSFIYALRGRLQQWLLYRVLLPACQHVFVQSEQMRHDVAAMGIALGSTTAVPSSVVISEIDAAVSREPVADKGPVIAYLGTLQRERELALLVTALALVLPRIPDARLEFIGSGGMPEDEEALLEAARRLDVASRVTITGWIPMREAWRRTRAARVCVSPYCPIPILRSTSPTKLVEYMALGKPVVGNEHPEQGQVLRQSGAGLVCEWDASDLADALVTLLGQPALCREMGEAGRRFVEQHRTHLALTDLVLDRYRMSLSESRPPIPATLLDVRSGRGLSQ